MRFRFFYILLILGITHNSFANEIDTKKLASISTSLKNILRTDTDVLRLGYSGNLLRRFDIYRSGIYTESKQKYQIIPNVWSKRPTMDVIYLYTPYIQKFPLSCEIASVRIILASLGYKRSEESIYQSIPHNPQVLSGGVWGNPEKEFVGYLTGTQGGHTGYGIYEKPLSDYIQEAGFDTEIINQDSRPRGMTPHKQLTYLLDAIKSGSHVILWGDWCTSPSDEDGILEKGGRSILHYFPLSGKNICIRTSEERKFSWKSQDNISITGLSGEHTFILLGYIGDKDWISHVIVWDTYTGRHIFSYAEWMRKWSLMEYRSLRIKEKNSQL